MFSECYVCMCKSEVVRRRRISDLYKLALVASGYSAFKTLPSHSGSITCALTFVCLCCAHAWNTPKLFVYGAWGS